MLGSTSLNSLSGLNFYLVFFRFFCFDYIPFWNISGDASVVIASLFANSSIVSYKPSSLKFRPLVSSILFCLNLFTSSTNLGFGFSSILLSYLFLGGNLRLRKLAARLFWWFRILIYPPSFIVWWKKWFEVIEGSITGWRS